MNESVRDVVVLGGGISGLTAAWELSKAGVDVCLLESQRGVGGCMRSERRDGFILEKGPFNVMVRDPAFQRMLEDLSGDVEVISASPAARARYIYHRGRLHKVPTSPVSLATTGLLSFGAKCRLIAGLLASARPGDAEETIEQVATRRFGRQVSDTMVSAVIAGIFAGDIWRLSLQACFPSAAKVDRRARSFIGFGLSSALKSMVKKEKGGHKRRWRGLISIDGGLGALTEALGRRLGSNLLTGCRAETIRRPSDPPSSPLIKGGNRGVGRYEVQYCDSECKTRRVLARRLVLASPALETGRLLAPLLPEASAILDDIECASLVVLNLGFRRNDVGHPMKGYGFLVPHNEPDFPLMGVLWADSIFPHHAPPDHRLIRVFIGGGRDPLAATRSEDELVKTSVDALGDLLDIRGRPVLVDVCRYQSAVPQYHVGHGDQVSRLGEMVSTLPGVHLVGNYLEGVSINDCVRLGTAVAKDMVDAVDDRSSLSARRAPTTPSRAVASTAV